MKVTFIKYVIYVKNIFVFFLIQNFDFNFQKKSSTVLKMRTKIQSKKKKHQTTNHFFSRLALIVS